MSDNPAGSIIVESSSIENSARDEETRKLEKTLKSYRKFCAEKETRKTILKDAAFLKMLTQCMTDNRPSVMKYLIQILLLLTEKKEDAIYLGTVEGLVKAIGLAQEGPFTPSDVKQLITISTRIQTVEKKKVVPTNTGDVADSRRFITRTNRQIVFEIDDMTETLRSTIETMCISQLGKRGLISVYCDVGKSRVVLRTTNALDAKAASEVLFDCGCEMVTQLTKIDGNDERFPMYASEREQRRLASNRKELPDYLEEGHTFDPSTTLVTKTHAQENGWLSSVKSYVKWW